MENTRGAPRTLKNHFPSHLRAWPSVEQEMVWSRLEHGGTWPRITYTTIGILLLVAWVGVMLYFAQEEVKSQKKNLDINGGKTQFGSDDRRFKFLLKGTLKKFDPIERSLRVSWALVYVAIPEDRQANATLLQPYNLTQQDLEAYIYRIDNITQPPIVTLGMHPFDSVDTNIDFTQAKEEDAYAQPLFGYPFDVWQGSIVSGLTDRNFSESLNLTNTGVLSLHGALLGDSTLNWRIRASANNTCLVEDINTGCELHLDFTGRRPSLVKFAALLAVTFNWTSAIGIFLLTCESVVMRRTHILTEADILGVCVAALFALPSVRAILLEDPDFGAINDLIGIIPNIIIISLCATALAISKITTRKPKSD